MSRSCLRKAFLIAVIMPMITLHQFAYALVESISLFYRPQDNKMVILLGEQHVLARADNPLVWEFERRDRAHVLDLVHFLKGTGGSIFELESSWQYAQYYVPRVIKKFGGTDLGTGITLFEQALIRPRENQFSYNFADLRDTENLACAHNYSNVLRKSIEEHLLWKSESDQDFRQKMIQEKILISSGSYCLDLNRFVSVLAGDEELQRLCARSFLVSLDRVNKEISISRLGSFKEGSEPITSGGILQREIAKGLEQERFLSHCFRLNELRDLSDRLQRITQKHSISEETPVFGVVIRLIRAGDFLSLMDFIDIMNKSMVYLGDISFALALRKDLGSAQIVGALMGNAHIESVREDLLLSGFSCVWAEGDPRALDHSVSLTSRFSDQQVEVSFGNIKDFIKEKMQQSMVTPTVEASHSFFQTVIVGLSGVQPRGTQTCAR